MKYPFRITLLLGLTVVVAAIWLLRFSPIPQPDWYHQFADDRCFLRIPNTLNVISNLPFVIVGAWGLWFLAKFPLGQSGGGGINEPARSFIDPGERWPYAVFFVFILLTGFGSAYYHSEPNNPRLLWDRLPLAVAFMAFLAIMVSERIDRLAGNLLLIPLVILGAGSVIYWHHSETIGHGDLRIYLMVQFYPLVLIPLMLVMFPAKYTRTPDLFGALAWYAAAKVLEVLDRQIYSAGRIVSGHTLKHLLAAMAPYLILHMIKYRRVKPY